MSEQQMRRVLSAVIGVLALTAVTATALALTRGDGAERRSAVDPPAYSASPTLANRFAVLRHANSNSCGMPATALAAMRPSSRLQGSCCFPMAYASYIYQVRALRRFVAIDVIPSDPYDIAASLAKRLTAYGSIELTTSQRATYEHAIPLSKTRGPCCCRCWRWTAFGGQARFLITRYGYSARQVADVWSLEEGCGGSGEAS